MRYALFPTYICVGMLEYFKLYTDYSAERFVSYADKYFIYRIFNMSDDCVVLLGHAGVDDIVDTYGHYLSKAEQERILYSMLHVREYIPLQMFDWDFDELCCRRSSEVVNLIARKQHITRDKAIQYWYNTKTRRVVLTYDNIYLSASRIYREILREHRDDWMLGDFKWQRRLRAIKDYIHYDQFIDKRYTLRCYIVHYWHWIFQKLFELRWTIKDLIKENRGS